MVYRSAETRFWRRALISGRSAAMMGFWAAAYSKILIGAWNSVPCTAVTTRMSAARW